MPFALPRSPSMSSSQVPQAAAVEKTARGVEKVSDVFCWVGLVGGLVGGGVLKPDMMNQHSELELMPSPFTYLI